MTPVGQNSIPVAPLISTRQGISHGTHSQWEAADLNGLFESHLQQSSSQEGGMLPHESMPPPAVPAGEWTKASAGPGTGSSEDVDGATINQPGGSEGIESVAPSDQGSSSEAASGLFQALVESGDAYSEIDAPRGSSSVATFSEAALNQSEANREVKLVLTSGEDAELYVRAPALDSEAALDFARSAEHLLAQHQVTLGRTKVNGYYVHVEDGDSSDVTENTRR